jgi:transposase
MTIETLGIDIAKNVFQLHGLNRGGRVVFKRRVMRDQLLEVVARLDRCTIAVEACTALFTGHESLKDLAIRSDSSARNM